MANWAIVIGVNQYWRPDASLNAAVPDALDMRTWLLDPNGGAVPERNLTLLLSPDPAHQPPESIRWTPATLGNIVAAIELLLQRSSGQGERFFLHFSGHGLTSRMNFSNQSAIVPADFTNIVPTNSLTVASLFELFKGTEFAAQYFFVDACRNLPFSTEARLGEYPLPRPPANPVRPQFVMFATQPGLKAIEINRPGDEHGAFTGALLRGLRGAGNAKRWDEDAGEYVVRWNSLFEFVERDVIGRALVAAATPNGPLIQRPAQYGERGSQNPELGRFGPEIIGHESLEVVLDPSLIAGSANIVVGEMAGGHLEEKSPPLALPVQFQLPPRTYSVRAGAPGYVSKRRFVQVDVYQPVSVRLELDPQQPPGPALPEAPIGGLESTAEIAMVEDNSVLTRGLEGRTEPGSVELHSDDPLATLELADGSGRPLASGRSPLYQSGLAPAFYRGRLISPEGDTTEQLIELQPAGAELVKLDASPLHNPLMDELLQRSGIPVTADNMAHPSESIGPAASMQPSTILALAAAAAMEVDTPRGVKLRAVGIPAFQSSAVPRLPNGVQLILGDEGRQTESWDNAEIRLWKIGDPVPEDFVPAAPLPTMTAVASNAFGCVPGAYWLWLKLHEGGDLQFPVAVLPDRVSLIVITRAALRGMTLHQYMPLVPAAPTPAVDLVDPHYRDPLFAESRFPALRRSELMQRVAAAGRITPALPDIETLLYDKWRDPMAGCLGCYMLLRVRRTDDLDIATRNLTEYFGGLADSHVLRGAWLERTDPEAAVRAYRDALAQGLPMFRDGLVLLADAVRRHSIIHDRVALLEEMLRHVPAGALWSASSGAMASLARTVPPATRTGAVASGSKAA